MIPIGKYSTLRVIAKNRHGARLSDGNNSVLLPPKHVPPGCDVGDELCVFVYTDSEDTPVATTQEPWARVGDFAHLEVVHVTSQGAFLSWGLDKDLFVPVALQHELMAIGHKYVVAVFLDERTNRVAGASALAEFFDYDVSGLEEGAAAELLVYGFSPLGAQVVVDGRYTGLIYASETFSHLSIGDHLSGFIRYVRPDNKLDISLQRTGAEGADDAMARVLEALEQHRGLLPLHDRTPPETIYAELGLSKKAFKAAVGRLYKQRLITLHAAGIRREATPLVYLGDAQPPEAVKRALKYARKP